MSIAHLMLMSLAHLFPFMYICIYVIRCVVWHKEIKNLNLNLTIKATTGDMCSSNNWCKYLVLNSLIDQWFQSPSVTTI